MITCHAGLLAGAAKRMFLAVGLMFTVSAFAHCNQGCKPVQAPTELEQNYTADIIACAYMAGSPGPYDRAEDLACRDRVNCKYHLGPCPDGGK